MQVYEGLVELKGTRPDKSAIDMAEMLSATALKELMIKNLYFSDTDGETLLYLNNRMASRKTYLDWNGQLMGPMLDEQGLEQGPE